jgi:hypothetical protein
MPSGILAAVDRDGPVVMAGTFLNGPTAQSTLPVLPSPTAGVPAPSGGLSGQTVGLILGILVLAGIAFVILRRVRK